MTLPYDAGVAASSVVVALLVLPSPPLGGVLLLLRVRHAGQRRQSQRLVVNGGNARHPNLHALAPGEKEEVVVFKEQHQPARDQNARPQIAFVVLSLKKFHQVSQDHGLRDLGHGRGAHERLREPDRGEEIAGQGAAEAGLVGMSLLFGPPQAVKVVERESGGIVRQRGGQVSVLEDAFHAQFEERIRPREEESTEPGGVGERIRGSFLSCCWLLWSSCRVVVLFAVGPHHYHCSSVLSQCSWGTGFSRSEMVEHILLELASRELVLSN